MPVVETQRRIFVPQLLLEPGDPVRRTPAAVLNRGVVQRKYVRTIQICQGMSGNDSHKAREKLTLHAKTLTDPSRTIVDSTGAR